jgi:hypothetical protein
MTNQERQKSLDRQKWFTSQMYKEDQSGKMPYCIKCEKSNCTHRCTASQKEREEQCLCAKAYNKLNKRSSITK